MNAFMDYFAKNYITVLVVAAILTVIWVNRRAKIAHTGLLIAMSVMVLLLSLLEFWEEWIDAQGLDYHLLYYKAMLVYWLYPAMVLFFLYAVGEVRHKLLAAVPHLVNMIIAAIDLTDTRLIYFYGEKHNYDEGPLYLLPYAVEDFYVLLISFYSIRLFRRKDESKSVIIAFIVVTVLGAQFFARNWMPNRYLPCVFAVEIFVYYFYLAAIQYYDMQERLHESRLALERNRVNLLMSQIRPHFINSNLSVIRSLCYEEPEKAVEMIDHFSMYLRENIQQMDDGWLVPFEKEMGSVDNYLFLESQRFPDRICVVKDITASDFSVPPLSIQTIVENAVRHGISMRGGRGTIGGIRDGG